MVYHDIMDLTHLKWTLSRNSSGTAGSFLKSYEQSGGIKYYYKLSNFDTVRGFYGHECLNEIIAQNIAAALHIPHLEYDLICADVKIDHQHYRTWLTRSADFKKAGEHKLAFETYYEINKNPDEDVWIFIERNQLTQYFYNIFILDYLICNRDRHGANIEVLEKKAYTTWRLYLTMDCHCCFPVTTMAWQWKTLTGSRTVLSTTLQEPCRLQRT